MKLMTKLISILLCLTALFGIFSTISFAEEPEESEEPSTESTTTTTSPTVPISIPEAPPTASLYYTGSGDNLHITVCLGSGSVKELHFKLITSDGVTLSSSASGPLLNGAPLKKGDEFSFSVPKPITDIGVLAFTKFKVPKGVTSTVKLVITKWIDKNGDDVTSSAILLISTIKYTPKEEVNVPTQGTQSQTLTGTFVYVPSDTVPTATLPQDFIDASDNSSTVTENTADNIVEVFSVSSTASQATSSLKNKFKLKDSHTNIKVIIIVAAIMLMIVGASVAVIIVSKKKTNN